MKHKLILQAFSAVSLIVLFILLTDLQAFAQGQNVSIQIINNAGGPVAFSSIQIKSITDSLLDEKVTDSLGKANFSLDKGRPYKIAVTALNYAALNKNIILKSNDSVLVIRAAEKLKALKSINISATRPVIRQEDDKTIVDPENLASSSTNAYEILEKTPGLFVDQDGNVYLSSTTPATIYINGREQKMNAADIATLLKNLPPNSIASIEILRTPSAKYDASGSGGIVNVVLKKGVKIGFTGSVNLGGNQGKYGNRLIGINLNNSNGNWSTYLNAQFNKRNNSERIVTNRIFASDSLLSQDAFSCTQPKTIIWGME